MRYLRRFTAVLGATGSRVGTPPAVLPRTGFERLTRTRSTNNGGAARVVRVASVSVVSSRRVAFRCAFLSSTFRPTWRADTTNGHGAPFVPVPVPVVGTMAAARGVACRCAFPARVGRFPALSGPFPVFARPRPLWGVVGRFVGRSGVARLAWRVAFACGVVYCARRVSVPVVPFLKNKISGGVSLTGSRGYKGAKSRHTWRARSGVPCTDTWIRETARPLWGVSLTIYNVVKDCL